MDRIVYGLTSHFNVHIFLHASCCNIQCMHDAAMVSHLNMHDPDINARSATPQSAQEDIKILV